MVVSMASEDSKNVPDTARGMATFKLLAGKVLAHADKEVDGEGRGGFVCRKAGTPSTNSKKVKTKRRHFSWPQSSLVDDLPKLCEYPTSCSCGYSRILLEVLEHTSVMEDEDILTISETSNLRFVTP